MPQENIFFVSMLAARLGVQTLAYTFPRVHIITTAIDPKVWPHLLPHPSHKVLSCDSLQVNRDYHILPGVGNYGDRYFGTEPD